MRALAHEARLSILELLHVTGTANATECAREIGGSPQAASYHLRALAKWGFVQRVDSADARETRWTLAARSITYKSGNEESPAFKEAARLLGRRLLERDERYVTEYLTAEDQFDREWRDAAALTTGTVYVTAEELTNLTNEFHGLIKRYERREADERPQGSRRVHVVFRAVPRIEGKPKRRKR